MFKRTFRIEGELDGFNWNSPATVCAWLQSSRLKKNCACCSPSPSDCRSAASVSGPRLPVRLEAPRPETRIHRRRRVRGPGRNPSRVRRRAAGRRLGCVGVVVEHGTPSARRGGSVGAETRRDAQLLRARNRGWQRPSGDRASERESEGAQRSRDYWGLGD
jgi:hypothetical protein